MRICACSNTKMDVLELQFQLSDNIKFTGEVNDILYAKSYSYNININKIIIFIFIFIYQGVKIGEKKKLKLWELVDIL